MRKSNKVFIALMILVVVISLLLAACTEIRYREGHDSDYADASRFAVVGQSMDLGNGYAVTVIEDTTTKVLYLAGCAEYFNGLCVWVKADGSPMTIDDWDPIGSPVVGGN